MSDPTEEAWHHEYYQLQEIVTGYNRDCLAIKNWSVTVAAIAIGYAYAEEIPQLLLVSALGAAGFLLTEAYWRANQQVFLQRVREIEEAPEKSLIRSPMISSKWKAYWKDENLANDFGHLLRSARMMRTWLPHGLILCVALGLFLINPPESSPDVHSCCHSSSHTVTSRNPSSRKQPPRHPSKSRPAPNRQKASDR